MKRKIVQTSCKKMLADVYTPVGIYLRLRDRFRDTILLESTDNHVAENSFSFICINAIGGVQVTSGSQMEYKMAGEFPVKINLKEKPDVASLVWEYMQRYEMMPAKCREEKFAQGLYGYSSYDAVQFFENIDFDRKESLETPAIPLIRYRLYQYVIVINHFKDELFICENSVAGLESDMELVESLIRGKDVPVYPFHAQGKETSNLSDEEYMSMVDQGIEHCRRGNIFQIVLSRRFRQGFRGDEFNVYRALRSINPSPYLFYFDYGDYKLMGSSPEAQLIVQNKEAIVHPIAGTFKRTGDEQHDRELAESLLTDKKENAEHVMLVDLARNDLSRTCDDVQVSHYREVKYYSHVIHLVSEVRGKTRDKANPFAMLSSTFPAGTLSGAPKFKAMQLINSLEPAARGYYGGAIGFIGFDGSCNHAIMIRTFLSMNNELVYQAGAGVVAASVPASELQEVNNKLNALKKAIELAENI